MQNRKRDTDLIHISKAHSSLQEAGKEGERAFNLQTGGDRQNPCPDSAFTVLPPGRRRSFRRCLAP